MQATVHYARPGKETAVYRNTLVSDDGRRLCTYAVFSPERSRELTAIFHTQNLLPPSQAVSAIRSNYFYHEYFDIIEWLGPDGEVAGYYSDIATPLRKADGEYFVTDLFLDWWVAPGQPALAMDEDEFEAAVAAGLLTAEWQAQARRAFERLREEIRAGVWPGAYIR